MSRSTSELIDALADLRVELTTERRTALLDAVGLVDAYAPVHTPIGDGFAAFNRRGVSFLRVGVTEQGFVDEFARRVGWRPLRPGRQAPPGLAAALRTGRGRQVEVDLRALTAFQRDVLNVVRDIPVGEVRPYGWVAARIGRPRAVRAVGSALGANPVPLVIPCHRVVRSDGRVGDYAFGAERKQTLLRHEHVNLEEVAEVHRRGFRLVASDTTGIFCHPSCHNARRITATHRVLFPDVAAATVRGFRPCGRCQPATGRG